FAAIYAAMTRADISGDASTSFQPERRLSAVEAIRLHTQGPAFAAGLENRRGYLAAGMDADFIVVDTDPCAAEGLNPEAARMGRTDCSATLPKRPSSPTPRRSGTPAWSCPSSAARSSTEPELASSHRVPAGHRTCTRGDRACSRGQTRLRAGGQARLGADGQGFRGRRMLIYRPVTYIRLPQNQAR